MPSPGTKGRVAGVPSFKDDLVLESRNLVPKSVTPRAVVF
jgi:hypothetical protein